MLRDEMTTTALWNKAVAFHGHECPGIAIGVVVSQIVYEQFPTDAIPELIAIVEYNMCPVDAFQVLLGCTFGTGKLIHKDYGKPVFTFHHRPTDKTIRISRNPDQPLQSKDHAKHQLLDTKVSQGSSTPEAQLTPQQQHQSQIRTILEHGQKLFTIHDIDFTPPPTRVRTPTTICESCSEPTQIHRIHVVNGKTLCIPYSECVM